MLRIYLEHIAYLFSIRKLKSYKLAWHRVFQSMRFVIFDRLFKCTFEESCRLRNPVQEQFGQLLFDVKLCEMISLIVCVFARNPRSTLCHINQQRLSAVLGMIVVGFIVSYGPFYTSQMINEFHIFHTHRDTLIYLSLVFQV